MLRNICENFIAKTIIKIYATKGLTQSVLLFEDIYNNVPIMFNDLNIKHFEFKENNTILEIYY